MTAVMKKRDLETTMVATNLCALGARALDSIMGVGGVSTTINGQVVDQKMLTNILAARVKNNKGGQQ